MAGWVAGKVALATGGGSGIGRASALTFAREEEEVVADVAVGSGEEAVCLIKQKGYRNVRRSDCAPHTRRSFAVTSNEALDYLSVIASCASQPNDPFLGNTQVA